VAPDSADEAYSPTLLIGIGGTATRTLRRLKRRLRDRFDGGLPSIQFLLLDTDLRSLGEAIRGDAGSALADVETLGMPLRSTRDYRNDARDALRWMSRRWLYNIPRSLQTEGYRPLGRLALVDHAQRFLPRLREALQTVASPDCAATSQADSGLSFRHGSPRVFVVASISGGTGSGMALDVAYAARHVLGELGYSDEDVHGVLLHSTPRTARQRDQATANAFATLKELWHYSAPGHHYPGDRACSLPAFHGNNRTFATCYFLPLGDELSETQWDAATDPVAEYLYCSLVTPAARFLNAYRRSESAAASDCQAEPTLRTFGLCQLGGSNSDIPSMVAEVLCHDLVLRWRGGVPTAIDRPTLRLSEPGALVAMHKEAHSSPFPELDRLAAKTAKTLHLDLDDMEDRARLLLARELSDGVDAYFDKVIDQALEKPAARNPAGRPEELLSSVLEVIDAILGAEPPCGDDVQTRAAFDSLETVLVTRIEPEAAQLGSAVADWVFGVVDRPTARVEGAKHAAGWFQQHFQELRRTATGRLNGVRRAADGLRDGLLGEGDARRPDRKKRAAEHGPKWLRETRARLLEYARLRVHEIACSAVCTWLRLAQRRVTGALDRLREFWKDLNLLTEEFRVGVPLREAVEKAAIPEVVRAHWQTLLSTLLRDKENLVGVLERAVERAYSADFGPLRRLLVEGLDARDELTSPLRTAARGLVLKTMERANLSHLADSDSGEGEDELAELRRCLDAANPRLPDAAAARRLLIVLPKSARESGLSERIRREVDSSATLIESSEGDMIACYEVEQVSLPAAAARVVDHRHDYVKIASRLHTRTDVVWSALPQAGR